MKYQAPGAAASALIAALACAGGTLAAHAAEPARAPSSAPNFAPDPTTGWLAQDDEFIAPPSGPGPVASDPAHPYVSFYKSPRNPHPAFRIADLDEPDPAAVDAGAPEEGERARGVGRGRRDPQGAVLAGRHADVPSAAGDAGLFLQTAKDVRMIWMQDHQIRDVRLDAEHPADLKPSWYRRLGRPLRGRHAGGRHRRHHHQGLCRQLPDAAHRSTARRRALPPDRRRQHARGEHPRRGPRRLHHAVERDPTLPQGQPGSDSSKWPARKTTTTTSITASSRCRKPTSRTFKREFPSFGSSPAMINDAKTKSPGTSPAITNSQKL